MPSLGPERRLQPPHRSPVAPRGHRPHRSRRVGWLALALTALVLGGVAAAQSSCNGIGSADSSVAIAEVQGSGPVSPLDGSVVTVEGVVSAAFLEAHQLGGFFLQDPVGDGDASTSEALFVTLPDDGPLATAPVTVGDRLRVTGQVREVDGMTRLGPPETLEVCGYGGLVPPTPAPLPVAEASDWEALEGMLVRFEPLTVVENFELGRYGRLTLAPGRLFSPTNGPRVPGSGADADAVRAANERARVVLDDGSREENPRPTPFIARDLTVRVGDRVERLAAVVVETDGRYELLPAGEVVIARANPRPAPPRVGGDLTVVGFNVQNFFISLGSRGADSVEELERQTDKLVAALRALDADIVALMEVENNELAAQVLADAVNAAYGREVYTVMADDRAGSGTDAIKQAVLYKPETVEVVGGAIDTSEVFDRPPVAGVFRTRVGGEVFTLIVNHFKSKGSCPTTGDVDEGFGCWNLRRSAQAQALADFAARLVESTGDPDVLLIGDLNSYRLEPPIALLEGIGYRNLDTLLPPEQRYTYVFRGESGTLDYALASPSLAEQVTGMANWHINADEPPVIGYDLDFNPDYLYRPYPYRSSDHDPVVVGLDLKSR